MESAGLYPELLTSTPYTILMLELDPDGALIGGLPLHLGKRAGA
jgi:hypothetical protein